MTVVFLANVLRVRSMFRLDLVDPCDADCDWMQNAVSDQGYSVARKANLQENRRRNCRRANECIRGEQLNLFSPYFSPELGGILSQEYNKLMHSDEF
jgi:hypothetical protein